MGFRFRQQLREAMGRCVPRAYGVPANDEGQEQMNNYESKLRRAAVMQRLETDPVQADWWAGYMRGLRRGHHGEIFGTEHEHQIWMSLAGSPDLLRDARGRGYRAGLAAAELA